jgi:hypothetical protein
MELPIAQFFENVLQSPIAFLIAVETGKMQTVSLGILDRCDELPECILDQTHNVLLVNITDCPLKPFEYPLPVI